MDKIALESALSSSRLQDEDLYFFDKTFIKECFDDTVIKMAQQGWSLIDFEIHSMFDDRTIIKMGFVYVTYRDELPQKSITSRFIVVDQTTAKLVD